MPFCRSVTRVDCEKTKETCAQILIPHAGAFILALLQEWMVEDDPFYLKFWVKLTLLEQKRRLSTDIRL